MRSQIEEEDFDARLGSKTGKPYWGNAGEQNVNQHWEALMAHNTGKH